jgi:hypothetical protein
MKCEKCGKEYPSEYYFKAERICNECYEKLPLEKQGLIDKKIKLTEVKESKKSGHAGVIRFISVVLVIFLVVLLIDMIRITVSNLTPSSSVEAWSVRLKIKQEGTMSLAANNKSTVDLDDAHGTFEIDNPTFPIRILFTIIKLVKLSLIVLIIYLLRKIFRTLSNNEPFIKTNVNRLRIIAFTIMAFDLYYYLLNIITSVWIRPKVTFENIYIPQYVGSELNNVFFGLLVLAIAEIFRIGFKMKEEQDLTI